MKLVALSMFVLFCRCDLIDYYENMIETEIEKILTYQYAEDASEYKPEDTTGQDAGTYDFIIVGAGPGGSILANRLTKIKNWTVLLLDAGIFSNDFTSIPHLQLDSFYTEYNWPLKTVPQTTVCLGSIDRVCPYLRGRGIGGGTIINHMIYARGSPYDYDRWALGNDGWSYEEVLPYFKKTEQFRKTNEEARVDWPYHGYRGDLNVEQPIPSNPQIEAFFDAGYETGYSLIDFNGEDQIGVAPPQLYTKKARRQDAGVVFIKPILSRSNLKVLERSYATKINIDESKTARSVKFTRNHKSFIATARKEIILASGVFGSAQLLLLSGIGPKEHLEDVGIDLIQNLEVGSTLRDHVFFPGLWFNTNWNIPVQTLRGQLQEWLKGKGILAFPSSLGGIDFFQSAHEELPNYPDIEIVLIGANSSSFSGKHFFQFNNETRRAVLGNVNPTNAVVFYTIMLRSHSMGTLRLKSNNPYDFPLIDSNVLSDKDDQDIDVLYQGIQMTLELANAPAFKKLNATLALQPLPQCSGLEYLSKDYWYCVIRTVSMPLIHGVATCSMGPSPENGHVVDSKLRVHGINNLRVADASVIPLTLAGHPSAAVMLVGEKAGDLIKNNYL